MEWNEQKNSYLFVFNDAVIDGGVVIILNESKFIIRFYVYMIFALIDSSRVEKKTDTYLPFDSFLLCWFKLNLTHAIQNRSLPNICKFMLINIDTFQTLCVHLAHVFLWSVDIFSKYLPNYLNCSSLSKIICHQSNWRFFLYSSDSYEFSFRFLIFLLTLCGFMTFYDFWSRLKNGMD